jgi:ferredoxin
VDGLCEVRFEPAGRTVWVQPGTTLLEAARAAGVDVATGCERGQCGTDPVEVAGGGLEPPGAAEQSTLERMGLSPAYRLSCSARLRCGMVVVRVGTY